MPACHATTAPAPPSSAAATSSMAFDGLPLDVRARVAGCLSSSDAPALRATSAACRAAVEAGAEKLDLWCHLQLPQASPSPVKAATSGDDEASCSSRPERSWGDLECGVTSSLVARMEGVRVMTLRARLSRPDGSVSIDSLAPLLGRLPPLPRRLSSFQLLGNYQLLRRCDLETLTALLPPGLQSLALYDLVCDPTDPDVTLPLLRLTGLHSLALGDWGMRRAAGGAGLHVPAGLRSLSLATLDWTDASVLSALAALTSLTALECTPNRPIALAAELMLAQQAAEAAAGPGGSPSLSPRPPTPLRDALARLPCLQRVVLNSVYASALPFVSAVAALRPVHFEVRADTAVWQPLPPMQAAGAPGAGAGGGGEAQGGHLPPLAPQYDPWREERLEVCAAVTHLTCMPSLIHSVLRPAAATTVAAPCAADLFPRLRVLRLHYAHDAAASGGASQLAWDLLALRPLLPRLERLELMLRGEPGALLPAEPEQQAALAALLSGGLTGPGAALLLGLELRRPRLSASTPLPRPPSPSPTPTPGEAAKQTGSRPPGEPAALAQCQQQQQQAQAAQALAGEPSYEALARGLGALGRVGQLREVWVKSQGEEPACGPLLAALGGLPQVVSLRLHTAACSNARPFPAAPALACLRLPPGLRGLTLLTPWRDWCCREADGSPREIGPEGMRRWLRSFAAVLAREAAAAPTAAPASSAGGQRSVVKVNVPGLRDSELRALRRFVAEEEEALAQADAGGARGCGGTGGPGACRIELDAEWGQFQHFMASH